MKHFSGSKRLLGLTAAVHTPFHPDRSLNLRIVEKQAEHLSVHGVKNVFIGGTTGECHSLSLQERVSLAEEWFAVTRGTGLNVVVHVGANCLEDAAALAAQAQKLGAKAISALAPSYFKPRTVGMLVECCLSIANAAPDIPFYYYDIPALTGVILSMPEFLEEGSTHIPNLAGLKFTNQDLVSYQLCLRARNAAFDCPWGVDEALLGALIMGAQGAVGSTYNFAAPIYAELISAFEKGDLITARECQLRSVLLVQLLSRYGYMGAAKAVMGMLGVEVGPARLPNTSLSLEEAASLRRGLESLGFFNWIVRTGDR